MAVLKAGIITPTTKEMLTQAEAERDRLRQALQMPTSKLDTLTSVLPNLVEPISAHAGRPGKGDPL